MKYEAEIQATRDFVWETFDNPDNLSRWQRTLESFTHQTGKPGQPGAVSKLVYNENGKENTITEKVTERWKPQFIASIYDNAWATSLIVNHFEKIDDNTTRFISYTNVNFKGVMKIMSLFVANSIRARAEANLDRFKLLVETDAADSD